MAKVLKDFDYIGKIFTFDIIPNRYKFYWNSPSDINFGKQTRLSLLNPWIELVNRYLIFLSTATFNSLRVIDIPEIHFVYVDGCHDFKDVFNEIEYLLERLCKKSIIIFDDYDEELFPGVVKACDYLSSLKMHSKKELIKVQNKRKLLIFSFGISD